MLKKIACMILILMMVPLTGCWNNRDLTDLGIVAGIGIDKASDGNIEMTVQILSSSKSGGSQMSSGSAQSGGSTVELTAEGATDFDAARNLIPSLSQKAYFSQIQIMVIGQDAAKEGLDGFWDFFERDHEVNRLYRVLVVKNGTAKSVLEANADINQIGAVEVMDSVENTAFGKSVNLPAFKVTEMLSNPLTGLVTGVIDPNGATSLKDMKVQGGAVFKKAKLVGYFDNDQTRGYLFAKNQIQSTILTIKNPKENGRLVSLELIRSIGNLTASIEDGKPKLGIEIKAYGNIAEEQGGLDLTHEKDLKALESGANTLIASDIKDMLDKSQNEFDCDVLNFNELLDKYHYSDFEKIKSNWDELYKNAEVTINVKFLIKRPGLVTKPAYGE